MTGDGYVDRSVNHEVLNADATKLMAMITYPDVGVPLRDREAAASRFAFRLGAAWYAARVARVGGGESVVPVERLKVTEVLPRPPQPEPPIPLRSDRVNDD